MGSKSPFEYHSELERAARLSKQSFVMMGEVLSALKHNDTFREAVGEGYDTWQAYLAQPEIGLSVSEANRLIQIYETFVLKFRLDPERLANVPLKNLHYLLPIVKDMDDESEVDALVNDAASLSQRDFRERIQDLKSDSGLRTYEFVLMKKCIETGSMRKVHGVSSADIEQALGSDPNAE